MPGNKALDWVEVTDFSPGLVTANHLQMPATGAQVLTDYMPGVEGGLVAAPAGTSFSTTGIVSTGVVCGVFRFSPVVFRSGAVGDTFDQLVFVFDTATNQVKVYRWDNGTVAAPSWVLIKTHAAVAATPNRIICDTFTDSTGARFYIYNLFQTSSDDGVWSITYSTGAVARLKTGGVTTVAVQDDRIFASIANVLWWTDSQTQTFGAPNNLPINASQAGNQICSIVPFAPSDLFIGCRTAPWVMLQGDITDPVVRSMSDARTPGAGQNGVFTTEGIGFIGGGQGIYLTGDGQNFTDISAQLAASTWRQDVSGADANGDVGAGNVAYQNFFLFAPHGHVFDLRTHSWFRLSNLIAAADHWHNAQDGNGRILLAATGGPGFGLYVYRANEDTPAVSGTYKSAPLRDPSGRQIRIREVQVYARAYNAATSTITVTVNGTARAVTIAPSGSLQHLSFLFSEYGHELDVQVVGASNGAVSAPDIEVVRIGTSAGHFLV